MTYKILGSALVRCSKHESPLPVCDTCAFLKQWNDELIRVKQHRARMLAELEKKLATREVVMVGLK